MAHFTWTKELSVGVDEMDQEHIKLIELMDELYILSLDSKPEIAKLKASFQKLLTATQEHFAHEESYLESRAYPDFKKHQMVHRELLQRLEKESRLLETGSRWSPESCLNFFQFWLKTHIKAVDQKYGLHFKSKLLKTKV